MERPPVRVPAVRPLLLLLDKMLAFTRWKLARAHRESVKYEPDAEQIGWHHGVANVSHLEGRARG